MALVEMARACAVLSLAVLSAGPGESPGVQRREKYYDLHGTTEAELLAAIREHGPEGELRGLTEWSVSWTFRTVKQGRGQCYVASVATKTDITVTFPRWVEASDASEELRTRWNRALSDLKRHEQLHVANAVRTSKAIERAVRSLPSTTDCEALEVDINLAANRELGAGRRRDTNYDLDENDRRSKLN
jgi:predicted secreted Zn-dependent protease